MRNRSRLLKAQHFAEDGSLGSTCQPLRASSLRTALELQTQTWESRLAHAGGG
jgi:hypothetical protein